MVEGRHVRRIPVLMLLIWLLPRMANSQSLELFGSAGPTITDPGNSLTAGAGFSPAPRIVLVFNFERTHLSSQSGFEDGVYWNVRGGTLLLATGEVRIVPFGRRRVGPYGVAGMAIGISHPNVNDIFREPVTNYVQALIVGGGIHVPVREQMTFFADVRMMFGGEGREGVVAVAPIRAGVSWRF